MTTYSGNEMQLSIGDGAQPTENFITIEGMRSHQLILKNETIHNMNAASDSWNSSLNAAGSQQLTLQASGVATDGAGQALLQSRALSHSQANMRITLTQGVSIAGSFSITRYEHEGEYGEPAALRFTLQSSEITNVPS